MHTWSFGHKTLDCEQQFFIVLYSRKLPIHTGTWHTLVNSDEKVDRQAGIHSQIPKKLTRKWFCISWSRRKIRHQQMSLKSWSQVYNSKTMGACQSKHNYSSWVVYKFNVQVWCCDAYHHPNMLIGWQCLTTVNDMSADIMSVIW